MPNSTRRSAEILAVSAAFSTLKHGKVEIRCPFCEYCAPYPPVNALRAWRYMREHMQSVHKKDSTVLSDALVDALVLLLSEMAAEHVRALPATNTAEVISECRVCNDPVRCAALVAQGLPLPCERPTESDMAGQRLHLDGITVDPAAVTIITYLPSSPHPHFPKGRY